jgi:hypothetical protein
MARRILCFVCCLTAGLSGLLRAQTLEDRIIFVPPVAIGSGASSSDAQWFTSMARMEIPVRGFSVGETREGSQYTLTGSLDEYTEDLSKQFFSLRLSLINNGTGAVMVEQNLVYSNVDETAEWYPVILFTMLSNIPLPKVIMPETEPEDTAPEDTGLDNSWQNKWLYVGGCVEWDHRRYIHGDASSFKDGIGGRLFLEFHFLNFMSVETGVEAAIDEPRYDGTAYKVYMLEGFAVLKGVLKPTGYCMFEPYGGVAVNIPLSSEIEIPSLSWLAGLQLGIKVGQGSLFVDISYSQDFADASIKDIDFAFQRQQINLGLGYKIGFFNRPASKAARSERAP